jgi:hypothetical protein
VALEFFPDWDFWFENKPSGNLDESAFFAMTMDERSQGEPISFLY